MTYAKWMITTVSLLVFFASAIIGLNLWDDWYGVRFMLFSGKQDITRTLYPNGLNQHMFGVERILRNPEKFDSLLFGSSRVSVIDTSAIPVGRFYNMSYPQGLPAEHLSIIKALLNKGVEIKNVMIGLDEFSFNMSEAEHRKQLSTVMHPDVNGPNRTAIFAMFFFTKPRLSRFELWINKVVRGKTRGEFLIDHNGLNLSWKEKEKALHMTGKPLFQYEAQKYAPVKYDEAKMIEAFNAISEMVALSKKNGFSLIFFVAPIYHKVYLQNADALKNVKEKLAQITDYYDFSGFNAVTLDEMNYYDVSHYRYGIGDMMIKRIYDEAGMNIPDAFGVRVTKENIGRHILNQQRELETYKIRHAVR